MIKREYCRTDCEYLFHKILDEFKKNDIVRINTRDSYVSDDFTIARIFSTQFRILIDDNNQIYLSLKYKNVSQKVKDEILRVLKICEKSGFKVVKGMEI